MKKNEIIQTLQNGISEIWYTDEHSIEHSMIGTLSQTHLPEAEMYTHVPKEDWTGEIINVFNVPEEKWQILSAHSVIDIEQLTGHGAENNEKKLTASDEYLAELLRTAEEDEE